jgi:hypothetical protein
MLRGRLSILGISKALGPLISEVAEALVPAESGTNIAITATASSVTSAPTLRKDSEEVPAGLTDHCKSDEVAIV